MHSDAPTAADTDWRQIVALYDQLMALAPTPVVALQPGGRRGRGRRAGCRLALVDDLDLGSYHLFHAVRADLLGRLGRAPRRPPPTTRRSSSSGTKPSGRSSKVDGRQWPWADRPRCPRLDEQREEVGDGEQGQEHHQYDDGHGHKGLLVGSFSRSTSHLKTAWAQPSRTV